ncbi:carbohydrate esterase family 5 protein [Zalerion maritima]|uniref:Cutinase n=1 Tax=Zalerion maritima TaxID=339359 RepID=A0AAD5WYB2_9PEZI|nr:carbohydrate esterase family 5 protein [Zalerion maritima]
MKFLATATALAGIAAAAPAAKLVPRQILTRNELESGSSSNCPDVILVYARGSIESGNMGTLGPPLADALESEYGASNVWIQGVGGAYEALLSTNVLPRFTTQEAIDEAHNHFKDAQSKCPDAAIVAGGYSQGSAVIVGAIEDASSSLKAQIKGTVLFGYTQNQQNDGGIPGYPSENVEVFCAVGDLVCTGTLVVTAAHLTYSDEAGDEAPEFLIGRINAS